jgi:hypothetical protein
VLNEVWKDVIGFEGEYEVSNMGNVRSLDKIIRCNTGWRTHKGQLLKPNHDRGGHPRVSLMREQKATYKFVHTLMMESFVGPRPKGFHVCHNNGVADDNRLENLRYDTPKGNTADKKVHGTDGTGSRNPFAKLDEDKVSKIKKLRREGRSVKSLAKQFDSCVSGIYTILRGESWQHVK